MVPPQLHNGVTERLHSGVSPGWRTAKHNPSPLDGKRTYQTSAPLALPVCHARPDSALCVAGGERKLPRL
jgi:hypothetical protein